MAPEVQETPLSEKEKKEIALVEQGSMRQFKKYIFWYSLCNKAQLKLIEPGREDLLRLYISKYRLCSEAQKLAIERGLIE